MGGMTVTEVDAGNIIVPPRQRKVNPVKEKVSHEIYPRTGSWPGSSQTWLTEVIARVSLVSGIIWIETVKFFLNLNDVNLVQLDRADNDGSDIDEWSLDMTRGEEYFFESFDSPSTKPNIVNRAKPPQNTAAWMGP